MKKDSNEITVRVTVSKDELEQFFAKNCFGKRDKFTLDDRYFIPNNLNIVGLSPREILAHAILIRSVILPNRVACRLTYKHKTFAENGDITSQYSINCRIRSADEAMVFFEAIGFHELMRIKEKDQIYCHGKFSVAAKYLSDEDILLEVETKPKTEWDNLAAIKETLAEFKFPIDTSNYFVKKAELALEDVMRDGGVEDVMRDGGVEDVMRGGGG